MAKILSRLLQKSANRRSARPLGDDTCSALQLRLLSVADSREMQPEGFIKQKQQHQRHKKKVVVPEGCVPLVINGQHRLFLRASGLGHPLVVALLERTAQESGHCFDYPGALRLSCADPASLHHLLRLAVHV
ncbi:hypothetical protein L7F22_006490 [Adiantum nelumboides]|nr:hypothetical protein [Adiantum nelumboides]